jgi:hypothetical protein
MQGQHHDECSSDTLGLERLLHTGSRRYKVIQKDKFRTYIGKGTKQYARDLDSDGAKIEGYLDLALVEIAHPRGISWAKRKARARKKIALCQEIHQ